MRLCRPPFFQSCISHSLEQYLAVWHFAQAAKRFEVSSGGSNGSVFGQCRRAHFLAVLAGKAYSKSSSQCQVVSWSAPSIFGVSFCIFAVSSSACSASDLSVALAIAAARRLACSSIAARCGWRAALCVALGEQCAGEVLRHAVLVRPRGRRFGNPCRTRQPAVCA